MWNMRRLVQFLGGAVVGVGGILSTLMGMPVGQDLCAGGLFVFLAGCFLPKGRMKNEMRRMKPRSLPDEALEAVPAAERDTAGDLFAKAQRDYVAIEQTAATASNPALRETVAGLQPIAVRIMDYMEHHPEKITLARKFVTYYQDRTAALVQEFVELEQTGVRTPQVEATMAKIRQTLAAMDEAYTAEFERLLSDKLLDVDAELKVMQQTLAADGIEDKGEAAQQGDGTFVDGGELPPPDETLQPKPLSWAERLQRREEKAEHGLQNGIGRKAVLRRPDAELAIIPAPLYEDVRRQRILMSALAILLGTFGAHRFYQGRIGLGILYVLFCATGLPTVIGIVEGLRYATMPLERFYEKIYRPIG